MLSYNLISRWFFSTNHKCGIYICLTKKKCKTKFYIKKATLKLIITDSKIKRTVKLVYKVLFFKRIEIQTLIIVFLIGKTKFLGNTFLYLLSSFFYEMKNEYKILKIVSIIGYIYFIIVNLKDSLKKARLFKYNHKSVFYFNKHFGTYRKFYVILELIKRCNTTSVIFDHKFLTSNDIRILKTLCTFKSVKKKYTNLFSLIKNPKFLFINYKLIISKLNNFQFSIYKITLNQIKYKWFKEITIRLSNGTFQFISVKTKHKNNFFNYHLIKLSNLKNEIVYQSILLILELIYERMLLNNFYGNKLKKGCHFVLKQIKLNWTKVSYIFNFEIQKQFSKLNINILTNLLKKKIKDYSFIHLIKRFLKINFKYNNLTDFTIFYTIYFQKFDLEMKKLQKKFSTIKTFFQYQKKKKSRFLNVLKYGMILTHKNQTMQNKLRKEKRTNYQNFSVNIKYIRYLNKFLLGFTNCSNHIKKKIEKHVTTFFNSNLKLLVTNKQLICLESKKFQFLNFEILFKNWKIKKILNKSLKKINIFRSDQILYKKNLKINKKLIIIKASLKKFKTNLIKKKIMSKNCKPKAIKWLLSYSNNLIVKWFTTTATQILNLYCCCDNFYKIKIYVDYIIRYSALYTLSVKNKVTLSEILNNWSRDMIIKDKKKKLIITKFLSKTYIRDKKKNFSINVFDIE